MFVDFTKLTANQAYFAMIQAVIPRPIAWVLSDSGESSYNLAPYSFFTGVCGSPPLIMISAGRKSEGSRKDTWKNIEERNDFVIHIAPPQMMEAVVGSAASLPHGESELTSLNLRTVPVEGQRLPRVEGPRLAMFCVKHAIHEVGDDRQGLILGEIRGMYVDDAAGAVVGDRVVINAKALDPLARLGGNDYATLGELMSYVRPK